MFVRLSSGIVLLASMGGRVEAQAKQTILAGQPPLGEASTVESADTEKRTTLAAQTKQRLASLVSIRANDSTVLSLIEAVARQAKMRVSYYEGADALKRRVSVNLQKMRALDAFHAIVKGTGLEVRPLSDGVTVVVRPEGKRAQPSDSIQGDGAIGGTVVDSASGKPVAGATVKLIGAALTGVTENSGRFSFVTESDGHFAFLGIAAGEYTVLFKLLGYTSVSRKVKVGEKGRVMLRVAMVQSVSTLSEVVTTVTGSQRKIEVGNDITTLDVPEIMKQAPITSVTDLLEARVPGLTVMRSSGVPGASSRIRLRGTGGGLLSGVPGAPTNDPIVIVDGIRIYAGQSGVDDQKLGNGKYPTPSPIDQIDPNSIEKIEVLKGPSASAMYGSDAGDGVIVITTKKGRPGVTRWEMAATGGIETMPGVYAAPGFYRFGHPANGGGSASSGYVYCPSIQGDSYFDCHLDSLVRFQALDDSRLSSFGRGTNTQLSATASGGTKELMYSVTGSMANTLGLTRMPTLYQDLFRELYDSAPSRQMRRPNSMDMKSGQASFSGNLSSALSATFTTRLTKSLQYQSSANDQLSTLASTYIDTANVNPGRPGQYAYQLKTDATTVDHALALNLLRWSWLPLTGTVGMNRVERSAEGLTPRGIFVIEDCRTCTSILTKMSKGQFSERHENMTIGTARINGTLFPGARTSVSLGSEIKKESRSDIAGVSDTLMQGVSRPSALVSANRSGRNTTTGGWFLEPRLNLNSRFFVNPGFRFDGGSASGSRSGYQGGLWSLFPKLNFSWIAVDREGGEPLWGVISLVRPRFALGVAGVQPAAEWSLRTLEQDIGSWDPTASIDSIAPDFGLRLRSPGNTQLGPEKTQEIEGGVDLQLWGTRLAVSATGYYKMRRNAIQQLPLASSVGISGFVNERDNVAGTSSFTRFDNYYANIGHVRNTGVELSLNAMILDLPNIGWVLDVSLSKYTNKLTKLFGDQGGIDLGNGTRLVEGYPLFGRWSRPISGWSDPKNGTRLWYGDYVVADSAVYLGMQTPDFEIPFRTSFTLFRGLLSVNGQFDYKAGMTQSNLGGQTLLGNIYENPNSTYGQQAYALAASCFIPNSSAQANGDKPCTDYGFIQTVNSLRFNSMSVGYNVPRSHLKRFPISSMSLSLQGRNLGLWTNYRGKDPDVNGALVGDATQDSGQLPMPRTWSLQIRIGT